MMWVQSSWNLIRAVRTNKSKMYPDADTDDTDDTDDSMMSTLPMKSLTILPQNRCFAFLITRQVPSSS